MTENQYDYMKIACRYAKNKKQAKESIMQAFNMPRAFSEINKSEMEKTVDAFINKQWSSRMKLDTYSLRKKTIREVMMLMRLLVAEKGIVFSKVLVPIRKDRDGTGLPKEFYDLVIKNSSKYREKLRGTHVELMGQSKDGLIVYCDTGSYQFMIHDIDRSKNLIFI